MVEPQIVVLVVAGSSPVGHPCAERRKGKAKFQHPSSKLQRLERGVALVTIANRHSKIENRVVSVAQPDRASDFGSEGWGFESLHARNISCILVNLLSSNFVLRARSSIR